MSSVKRKALLAAFLSFLLSGMLWAQSDFGTISGYVKDPSGATIPKAAVTVANQSGLVRQATTTATHPASRR